MNSDKLASIPTIQFPSTFPSSLNIFTMRHGERVDLAFGNDWIEQAFKVHTNPKSPASAAKDEISENVDHSDAGTEIPSTGDSSDSLDYSCRFPCPPGEIDHCTYKRFNLNMPKDIPVRMPRRSVFEYLNDSPLTECGHWQAGTVGEALRGMNIRIIYASPALRSIQTAQAVVNSLNLASDPTFSGIRIEPGMFEFGGWYSKRPSWMAPKDLRAQGFSVDADYQPLTQLPKAGEKMCDWYARSAEMVKLVLESYGSEPRGNILFVGHAGTADVISYGLLTGRAHPHEDELDLGSRERLSTNYCGIARLRYSGVHSGWLVCDDSHFDIHNTANEPFSFQLNYQSLEKQFPVREAKLGFSPAKFIVNVDHHGSKEDRVIDLNFRKSFGLLLDSANRASEHLLAKGEKGRAALKQADLDSFLHTVMHSVRPLILALVPEWSEMSAHLEGCTELHVYKCFVATSLLIGRHSNAWNVQMNRHRPQFNGFPLCLNDLLYSDKNIFSWAVLLHDLGKVLEKDSKGQILRDATHPFTSAVRAAQVLARQGFMRRSGERVRHQELSAWSSLVTSAVIADDEKSSEEHRGKYNRSRAALKHDNSKLPEILTQLDQLFGSNTAAVDIIKLILFHQSISWLSEDFPAAAPLRDEEIPLYFTPRLLFLSGLLALIDSGSYQLNHPEFQLKCIETIEKRLLDYLKRIDPDGEFQPNPYYYQEKQQIAAAAAAAAEAAKNTEEEKE